MDRSVGLVLLATFLFSFVIGYRRARWRFVLLIPIAWVAIGAWAVTREAPGYDMPGFGYLVGLAYGVLALAFAPAGRAVRYAGARVRRRI
jgi:hypothetical protein